MKKNLILVIIVFAVGMCSEGEPETIKEMSKKISSTLCEKQVECLEQMLENLPEEQRAIAKSAKSAIPNVNDCITEAMQQFDQNDRKLKPEETKAGKACLSEVQGQTCTEMESGNSPACINYYKLAAAE